jgi:hypothetical protein
VQQETIKEPADTIKSVLDKPKPEVKPVVQPEVQPVPTPPVQNEVVQKDTIVTTPPSSQVIAIPNSNCKVSATEDDFFKFRRKLAGESKEEVMVEEAKKQFRVMCFSTEQLKNLAVLFFTDEWRYRFYDAALIFVTDFPNFKSLESTMQDEYYKNRFRALIPNN